MSKLAIGVTVVIALFLWEIAKSVLGNLLTPAADRQVQKVRAGWRRFLVSSSAKSQRKYDKKIDRLDEEPMVVLYEELSDLAFFAVLWMATTTYAVADAADVNSTSDLSPMEWVTTIIGGFAFFGMTRFFMRTKNIAVEIQLRKAKALLAKDQAEAAERKAQKND